MGLIIIIHTQRSQNTIFHVVILYDLKVDFVKLQIWLQEPGKNAVQYFNHVFRNEVFSVIIDSYM